MELPVDRKMMENASLVWSRALKKNNKKNISQTKTPASPISCSFSGNVAETINLPSESSKKVLNKKNGQNQDSTNKLGQRSAKNRSHETFNKNS